MWALAVTVPQNEFLVCRELRDRFQLPHHFFLQNKRLVLRGQVIQRPVPAFPRYILVPFEAAWEVIRQCWRVIDLVHFGEQVAPVPQAEVDRLLARCQGVGDHVLPAVEVPEPFKLGETVQVGGYGVMSGHSGIYQHRVDDGKLCVLFEWGGRWVPIDVDERDVSAVVAVERVRKARKKKKHHRSRKIVKAEVVVA